MDKDPTLLVNILAGPLVGDVVYALSSDRRYGKNDDGIQKWCIVGETRMSWLISLYHTEPSQERFDFKLPKKGEGRARTIHVSNYGSTHRTFYFDRKDLEENIWLWDNRYAISREVEHITDPQTLRAVAALVNYVEK